MSVFGAITVVVILLFTVIFLSNKLGLALRRVSELEWKMDGKLLVPVKETNPIRIHDIALRFIKDNKKAGMKYDIEVCGLLADFISACGVMQIEIDQIYKED